jgi:hypothetical protein
VAGQLESLCGFPLRALRLKGLVLVRIKKTLTANCAMNQCIRLYGITLPATIPAHTPINPRATLSVTLSVAINI